MTKSHNPLRDWVEEYISYYRSEQEKFSQYTKYYRKHLVPPLQVRCLWIWDMNDRDIQILLFQHNSHEDDLIIEVFEPKDRKKEQPFEINNFLQSIDKSIKKSIDYLIVQLLFNEKFKEFETHELNLTNESYLWSIIGKFQDTNWKKNVDKEIREAKDSFKFYSRISPSIITPQLKENVRKNSTEFWCGVIRDNIWIGNLPEISLEGKYGGSKLRKFVKTVISTNYRERQIFIQNDGSIAITIDKKIPIFHSMSEDPLAIQYLNEIFSALLLNGYDLSPINPGSFTKSGSDKKIRMYLISPRKLHNEAIALFPIQKEWSRISVQNLKFIIKKTEEIVTDKDLKIESSLHLIIHVHRYINNLDFTPALLLSWTIIEQHVNDLWKKLIRSSIPKRKKRLDSSNYTASIRIEFLEKIGLLSIEEYSIITRVRQRRNDFMHKIKNIDKKSAEIAYNLAFNYIKDKTKRIQLA